MLPAFVPLARRYAELESYLQQFFNPVVLAKGIADLMDPESHASAGELGAAIRAATDANPPIAIEVRPRSHAHMHVHIGWMPCQPCALCIACSPGTDVGMHPILLNTAVSCSRHGDAVVPLARFHSTRVDATGAVLRAQLLKTPIRRLLELRGQEVRERVQREGVAEVQMLRDE